MAVLFFPFFPLIGLPDQHGRAGSELPVTAALADCHHPLAGGMNIAVVTALVVSGAFLLGAGVFEAYWYIRHRETQPRNN